MVISNYKLFCEYVDEPQKRLSSNFSHLLISADHHVALGNDIEDESAGFETPLRNGSKRISLSSSVLTFFHFFPCSMCERTM